MTANKSVLAEHGKQLQSLAREQDVALLYSAAVGGNVPMLEAVRRIAIEYSIIELRGLVNGSTNFILGQIQLGDDFDTALQQAASLGFTEADPTRDLDGTDAAEKLRLLSQAAGMPGSLKARSIKTTLSADTINRVKSDSSDPIRHVARLTQADGQVVASVSLETIADDDALANVVGARNALSISVASGERWVVRGTGAGRWATAEAVFADLLQLRRELVSQATLVS